MNNKLVFALLSLAVYDVVNFIDKCLIDKKVKDYPVYPATIGNALCILSWLITGLKSFCLYDIYYILIVDIMWAVSAVFVKSTIQASDFVYSPSYKSWGIARGGILCSYLSLSFVNRLLMYKLFYPNK